MNDYFDRCKKRIEVANEITTTWGYFNFEEHITYKLDGLTVEKRQVRYFGVLVPLKPLEITELHELCGLREKTLTRYHEAKVLSSL